MYKELYVVKNGTMEGRGGKVVRKEETQKPRAESKQRIELRVVRSRGEDSRKPLGSKT